MIDVIQKVRHAATILALREDRYSVLVFILRSIRESYQISQKEMAGILGVAQSTVSKFESMYSEAKLDFMIDYAYTLGYNIYASDDKTSDEATCFQTRQDEISNELSKLRTNYIEDAYLINPSWRIRLRQFEITRDWKRIIKRLLAEKGYRNRLYVTNMEKYTEQRLKNRHVRPFWLDSDVTQELTTKLLSEKLGVSEKTVEAFEKSNNSAPSAMFTCRYASLVGMILKLTPVLQTEKETLRDFFLRNCIALYGTAEPVKRANQAVLALTAPRDKYDDLVFTLRSIRESYQVSQEDIAILLNTTQSKISKLESMTLGADIEFLISYAALLGYQLAIYEDSGAGDELSRFTEMQTKITKELSKSLPGCIERIKSFKLPEPLMIDITLSKRNIQQELFRNKHVQNMERLTRLQVCIDFSNKYQQDLSYLFPDDAMEEITPKFMAKAIGKSDQTIRRFENDEDFASPAKVVFKYAAFVKTEFRLEPQLSHEYESLSDFYIRKCFDLNNAIQSKVPNT